MAIETHHGMAYDDLATIAGMAVGDTDGVGIPGYEALTVASAGLTDANGAYTLLGTAGGKPYYGRTSATFDYIINWQGGSIGWRLSQEPLGGGSPTGYYNHTSDTTYPPTSGWVVISTSPAPTISY